MQGLPNSAGVGFKPEHFAAIRQSDDKVGFFEVHAENYMGAGGLSIGGPGRLSREHLGRLRALCDRYEPESFSEHLAWSSHGTDYLNDLLPLPYTDETLAIVSEHVDEVQEVLGRRMLLENPSTYVLFEQSTIPETEFLTEVARRTGCGLLLDVNNVFVSATNHRMDARAYLAAFPLHLVGEIHLGGHAEEDLPSGPLLIDAHGTPVADPVWALYAEVIARSGPLPTLIEWDNDLPDWPVLRAEARRAQAILDQHGGLGLACAS